MRTGWRWVGALSLVLGVGTGMILLVGLLARAAAPSDMVPTTSAESAESVEVDHETPSGTEEGAASAHDAEVDGIVVRVVSVVDGDTLRVDVEGTTERLRIIGIDTPELRDGQCLAQEAASRMQSLVQSRSVRITADDTQADRDVYGRLLRHVVLLDGRNVALELLSEGLASEYTYAAPYLGVQDYRAAQAGARDARLGLWGEVCDGWATAPSTAATPLPGAAASGPSSGCEIKGNINAEGERIYHVPGQRYYADTRVDVSRGERWFCSEDEARDAGWRRARTG